MTGPRSAAPPVLEAFYWRAGATQAALRRCRLKAPLVFMDARRPAERPAEMLIGKRTFWVRRAGMLAAPSSPIPCYCNVLTSNLWISFRKPPTLLKTMLFLVSVVPVFLLVKSLLFKRSAGAKAAVSNFSRQVGYLATGIGAILVSATIYHVVNAWLR